MKELKEKTERQKEREALAIEIQTGIDGMLQELEDMDKAEDETFDVDLSPAAILQIVWRTNKGLLHWRPLKELASTDVKVYIVGRFESEIIDSESVKMASVLRRDDEFIEMESYQRVTHYISRLDAERLFKWIKIATDGKVD